MKVKVFGFFATVIITILLFFVGIDARTEGNPIECYQVYLNGDKIGLIDDKQELYDLIDREQSQLKEKYHVDKVYPPNGLSVEKIFTYNNNIVDVNYIYNLIKDSEPFTVEGYTATVTYTEKKIQNDGDIVENREPVYIHMLDKSYFEKALYNTAAAFIGSEELKNYEANTQKEITDVGEVINSVYFEETLTIKKDYISTDDYIFTNVNDLSKYLLFGTLDEQKTYTVKEGENLDKIADANNLNIEELLVANPKYTSADVLLTAGEKLNVGLISPIVSVIYKKKVVQDITNSYKTEYIDDNTKYNDYKVTTQKGENGITRITQDIKYSNGEIQSLQIVNRETIKDTVNEVITRGTKTLGGGYYFHDIGLGNESWSWPTVSPFVITSGFKWRWGRQHQGIDISGTGYGSPIYAVNSGVAYQVNYDSSKAEGLAVYIDHGNGYCTIYMHLSRILVKAGDTITREQKIGLMGSSGSSTGTHLHLGVFKGGRPYQGGVAVDPCASIFSC